MVQVEVGASRPLTPFSAQVRAAAFAARQAAQVRRKCRPSPPVAPASAAGNKKKPHLKLQLDQLPKNNSDFFVIEAQPCGDGSVDSANDGVVNQKHQEIRQQTWSSPPPPNQLDHHHHQQRQQPVQNTNKSPLAPPRACSPLQLHSETPRGSSSPSRRRSSVTMDLNQSPQGQEFDEVVNDGPVQLGKKTKKVRVLGKGASGCVYLSVYLPLLRLVAVKEVTIVHKQDRDLVKQELHALHENLMQMEDGAKVDNTVASVNVATSRRLSFAALSMHRCEYLLGFYGAYLVPYRSTLSIVMEFMDMGSLQDLVDSKLVLHECMLRHIAFCGFTALEHMHKHRLIHRDIKPANILCNRTGQFKVSDFGLAGELAAGEKQVASEFEGTVMYMAPERLLGQDYSYPSDVWSLGLTLFTLAAGAYPFQVEDGFFGVEEAITQEPLPPLPRTFSPVFRDFVKLTLHRVPQTRLSAAQALQHPFLAGYAQTLEFRQFPAVWQSLCVQRQPVVQRQDVEEIAQLLVEYADKYPDMVQLPKASQMSTAPKGFLNHMTNWLGSKSPKANEANHRYNGFDSLVC